MLANCLNKWPSAPGLIVPGQVVDAVILADPNFHENGEFSAPRYENLLRSGGISPAMYRRMMGEDLLLQQVTAGLVNSEFLTDAEMQVTARIVQQKRDLRYVTVPAAGGDDIEAPGEDELVARYETDRDQFLSEETVDIEYIELRRDQLSADIEESELRAEYSRRMDRFADADERRAAHILIEPGDGVDDATAQANLRELRARLERGESFADLAREYSDDVGSAANGGDLGFSSGDAFPEEFEDALATLRPSEVSDPVQTDAGWHLIKLVEMVASEPPSFEELRVAIEQQLRLEGTEEQYVQLVEQLADLAFNADDLQLASTELNLPIKTAKGLSRESSSGLFADPRLRQAAFDDEVLGERMNSEPVELASDHVVILRVTAHSEPRPLNFDEVRATLFDTLLAEKRRDYLTGRGEGLLATLQAGERVDALAAQAGLEWQVVLAATRTSNDISRDILGAGFELAAPITGERGFTTALLPDGGLAVIEVTNVVDGELSDLTEAMQTQLRTAMQQTRAEELLSAYRVSLRAQAEVELL